ncbi:MAG: hypothetical protein GTO63_05745 [Anaerolineae bacterium]|nr:hypothetical protein [Anaerolineae bacterium]NIN94475.1 hypothetical protein [Anaerolineae bacterium]NIQ77544.1 hypothetical protein [Anaerolineae bacterium]
MNERIEKAIKAYRLALKYREKVLKKWELRGDELRSLDEFHRTRVAWENDMWRSEELEKATARTVLGAIKGEPGWMPTFNVSYFEKCRNRDFLKVWNLLKEMIDEEVFCTIP